MDFKLACQLLGKGARWGDLEVMDYEDIILDLQNRSAEILEKRKRIVEIEAIKSKVKYEVEAARILKIKTETPVKTESPFDFSKKKSTCIGCKKFTAHSNPPSHFTDEDKMYCCAYCNATRGKRHGNSCEKKR